MKDLKRIFNRSQEMGKYQKNILVFFQLRNTIIELLFLKDSNVNVIILKFSYKYINFNKRNYSFFK